MPYKVPNVLSYSPFGHGGGLTKAVANLFGGGNQADGALKQSQADMNRAHGEYYLAQRDAALAEMAAKEQARRDLEEAPRKVAGAIFGNQPLADLWMKSRDTGSMPVAEFRPPEGGDMGPVAEAATPVPAQFDPNLVANATRVLTGIAAAKALPGNDNLKHLGELVGTLYAQGIEDDIRNGKIDPTKAAAAGYGAGRHKNEPFKQGTHGMGNVLTGAFADPALFNADVKLKGEKVNTEKSQQQQNRAQAGLRNEELKRLQADTLVPVLDPTTRTPMLGPDNKPIMIRASEQGKILQRGEDKRATQDNGAALKPPGSEKPPIKVDAKLLRSELGRLVEEGDERMLDSAFANSVVSRAMALAQESGGEFWNKPVEAVRVALMEATGGKDLTDITGSWRDRNKRFAPPGFKPQQSGGAITPAPAAGAPKSPTSAPVKISGDADYAALPSGAEFIAPDGTRRRKP